MPSTYSTNLRIELIASGEQGNTWGNTTNNNLGTLIENAISGFKSIDTVWSSNVCTLTALYGANDQARNMYLEIPSSVGLSAEGQLIAPTVPKMYVIKNNSSGGYAVRIKTGSSSTTCLIPNGTSKVVVCDGSNFYEATTAAADFYIANTPTTSLQATNKSYVDTRDNLKVNKAGDTMTGELILSSGSAPSNSLAAISKNYATTTFLPLAGGTMSGSIILPSVAPTFNYEAAPKIYVDSKAITASAPLTATGNLGTGISMTVATATASSLGVVKGGGNVQIAGDGTLSVSGLGSGTVTSVTGSAGSGFVVSTTNPTTTPTVAVSVSTGLTTLVKASAGSLTNASSSDVISALGYTPYNSSNPTGYITSSALTGYATQSYVTSQGYATSSSVSTNYVAKSGGTMTGTLNVQNASSPSAYISLNTIYYSPFGLYYPTLFSTNSASSSYAPILFAQTSTTGTQAAAAVGTAGVFTCYLGLNVTGGTKNFVIDHPVLADKKLLHAAVEAPRADLIYRGKVSLLDGEATVNIDAASNMAAGTFAALTQNAEVIGLSNKGGFTRVYATDIVEGSFTIYAEDSVCSDEIVWAVMAERADDAIKNAEGTDAEGHLRVERDASYGEL